MTQQKIIRPLAFTGLVSLLAACGGESATINENPNNSGPKTSTNGCLASSNQCQTFVLDYPASGINFDCKSDDKNHFNTELIQNVVTGGCGIQDTAKFYIQGPSTDKRISLGEVNLGALNPKYTVGQPTQVGLLDIAVGMTGKPALNNNLEDETFRVLVALVRIFQSIAVEQNKDLVGDLQPVNLDDQFKNELSKLESSIDVKSFVDGSYEAKLKPWLDVSGIDQQQAVQVAQQLLNLSNVNIYIAEFLSMTGANLDLAGFTGKGDLGNESIASLYSLTTRQGQTLGYALQWTGKPLNTGTEAAPNISRMNLITQVQPQKLNAEAQLNWINPLSKKIGQALELATAANSSDRMRLEQGTFFNGTTIPGNESLYKFTTGYKQGPADPSVYGKWSQRLGGEQFSGSIDIFRSNPAAYLDRRVFLTPNTVHKGEQYIFPLYATLTFDYGTQTTLAPEKLSIVIEANGDIRTNMASTEQLASNQCGVVDPVTLKDNLGVQQYIIGTSGATNFTESDKSVTVRMILANPIFKNLDGAVVGLNQVFISNTVAGEAGGYVAGGVRLNLQNLIVDRNTTRGINITGWNAGGATAAEWSNMLAVMQVVYNTANPDKIGQAERDLALRNGGRINIELPQCYNVKTKV